MIPFAQKKLSALVRNKKYSKSPMSLSDKVLLDSTILIARKTANLNIWKVCKPDILLTYLLKFNDLDIN